MMNENLTKEELIRATIEENATIAIINLINEVLYENASTNDDCFTMSLSIITNALGNILLTALIEHIIIEKDIVSLLEQVKSFALQIIDQHKKQMKQNN